MYMPCRKAVATAFSTANMKAEFPNIRLACSQLIEVLKTVGPKEVVDIDSALCRESLDVIGQSLVSLWNVFNIWDAQISARLHKPGLCQCILVTHYLAGTLCTCIFT